MKRLKKLKDKDRRIKNAYKEKTLQRKVYMKVGMIYGKNLIDNYR